MTEEPQGRAWFEFRIEETEGRGVEAGKLSRLLQDMSSAFYAIARARLGKEAARPGRRAASEDALAAIRIVRLSPGSAILEADPPTSGLQAEMGFGDHATAEDVLFDFALEAQRIEKRERSEFLRPEIRKRVQAVLKDAADIGRAAEVVIRPRGPRRPVMQRNDEFRVRFDRETAPDDVDRPQRQPRRRRLSGHAYMVDLEPGRFRVRLKLPDGRDLTLDTAPGLADQLKRAVDHPVELEAIEELEGDQVASRTVVDLAVLPSSGAGNDNPPKSVVELAREQGLLGKRPDYRALAGAIWETEDQLTEFERELRQLRQTAEA